MVVKYFFSTFTTIQWSFYCRVQARYQNLPNHWYLALVLTTQGWFLNITAAKNGPDKDVLAKSPWGNWQYYKDRKNSCQHYRHSVYLLLCSLKCISLPNEHCQVSFCWIVFNLVLQWRFISLFFIWFPELLVKYLINCWHPPLTYWC